LSKINTKLKVLFLGKKNDSFADIAANICKEKFKFTKIFFSSREDRIENYINKLEQDILISYLFPKHIKKKLLANTKMIAINFHPGPPNYPGIGCSNYAIYNNEKEYGVTSHIIKEKVDSGPILEVRRFALNKKENLFSLTQRAYIHLFEMYLNIINQLQKNEVPEIKKNEKWVGKAKTRKQFENFLLLNPNMEYEEIKRRIEATTWPGKGSAYFNLKGFKFEGKLKSND
jgi:methionyl-tRNA formyltransferase